jgi:hypothetical protein
VELAEQVVLVIMEPQYQLLFHNLIQLVAVVQDHLAQEMQLMEHQEVLVELQHSQLSVR